MRSPRSAVNRFDHAIPLPLPPQPLLTISSHSRRLLERATLAVGRLDSVSLLLPNPHIFLYAYVRREAVLSSQIEGTQSSLADLLLFEMDQAPGTPLSDVLEVSGYVAANEGTEPLTADPKRSVFYFSCVPSLHKQHVLELAQGG